MSHGATMERVRRLIAGPGNESIEAARAARMPVVGYFCSYTPAEIMTAAGCLPVRMRGASSADSATADVYMSSRVCTYVRHAVCLVLEGKYDFLEGVVCANTCDHVRRSFDVFRHKTDLSFFGFLSVPRSARESLYPYYREEVANLKESLEKHFAKRIDEDSLREAIRLHNAVRRRLARLDELRASDESALTGADMLALTVASQVIAPGDFEKLADELEDGLEGEPGGEARARLLLAGGELDEPEWVAAVEGQGARIVADSLCLGMRAHQSLVAEDSDDPLDAICRRYFFQVSCARMIGNFPDRAEALFAEAERREVDGVIFQRLKFCDPWGGEAHNLRLRAARRELPLLVIEREYGLVNSGQLRTRVQAFMEMIESRRARRRRLAAKASAAAAEGASKDA